MPSKSGFYSKTPKVPSKKMADTNPVGAVASGSIMPGSLPLSVVPRHPGKTTGLVQPAHTHGFGHKLKAHKGHLRLSGNSNAHQVGKVK